MSESGTMTAVGVDQLIELRRELTNLGTALIASEKRNTELQAEVARLKPMQDFGRSAVLAKVAECEALKREVASLQSWKESVIAERGPAPVMCASCPHGSSRIYEQDCAFPDCVSQEWIEWASKQTNHLAAKLVEAKNELASIAEYDCYGDVGYKDCPGCAACDARKFLAKSQPQPLNECSTLCHPDEACMISADGKCPDKPLPGAQPPAAITIQTVIDEMGNCADLCERIADERRGHTVSYRAAAIRCRDEIHERMGAVRYSLSQKLGGEQLTGPTVEKSEPWETTTQYGRADLSLDSTVRDAYRVACLIERCGASEDLTRASSAAFDLCIAIFDRLMQLAGAGIDQENEIAELKQRTLSRKLCGQCIGEGCDDCNGSGFTDQTSGEPQ